MKKTNIFENAALAHMLAALLVAGGLVAAGCVLAGGMERFRSFERTVTVKGLAEREVQADLALWPLSYALTGNNLIQLQQNIRQQEKAVNDYLLSKGLNAAELEKQPLQSQDLMAQGYRPDNIDQGRYVLTQTILVRSTNIAAVASAATNLDDLLGQGVVLSSQNSPTYLFTALNDVKPEMLDEAIEEAKKSAETFAVQSGQRLGKIKQASQGVFQISGRDDTYTIPDSSQMNKKLRVVSTITFYLR